MISALFLPRPVLSPAGKEGREMVERVVRQPARLQEVSVGSERIHHD